MYIVCLFECYYLRVNQSNWDEIFDPTFATSFKTKKEAKQWMKTNTTMSEHAQVVNAKTAIKNYTDFMKNGGIRRSFDFVNNDLSRPYKKESPEEILNWHLTIDPDELRFEDYCTWPNLYERFEHLWAVERYHNDDFTDTFSSVSLRFKKSSKYDVFKKELNLVLPHVTLVDKKGYKIFSVFDHFLAEGGNVVSLFYKTDDDCYISGRWVDKFSGTLEKCFTYLKTKRSYD